MRTFTSVPSVEANRATPAPLIASLDMDAATSLAIQQVRDEVEKKRNQNIPVEAMEPYNPKNAASLQWRPALALIEECMRLRVPISVSFSSRVMSLLTKCGQPAHAEVLLEAIISRRGGMSLHLNHVRSILKYYVKTQRPDDAARVFDTAVSYLHETSILWLLHYMMRLYDAFKEYDKFRATFFRAQNLPEESTRQLCHQVLMEALTKSASVDAVVDLYNEMKRVGMIPVSQIMIAFFRCLALHRRGELALDFYLSDFLPRYQKRQYSFLTWKRVVTSVVTADIRNLDYLLAHTPASAIYQFLWIVSDEQRIDTLTKRIIELQGRDGPSKIILTKVLLQRAAMDKDWAQVVSLYEQLPNGDSLRFPSYLTGLSKTNRGAKVAQLFYAAPDKFRNPAAAAVALSSFFELKDGLAVMGVVNLLLHLHSLGQGVSRRVVDSAVFCVTQLRPIEEVRALWSRLLLNHSSLTGPHSYLAMAVGYLRHNDANAACEFLATALQLAETSYMSPSEFRVAFERFVEAKVLRPNSNIIRLCSHPENGACFSPSEVHEALQRLAYDFDLYGVNVVSSAIGRSPLAISDTFLSRNRLKDLYRREDSEFGVPT